MRTRLAELKEIEQRVHESPHPQISLTDPDSIAMATNMWDASVVGYNMQAAVDTEHQLIVAHEVTNVVVDRTLLAPMAAKSKDIWRRETLDALADRGYTATSNAPNVYKCGKPMLSIVPRSTQV